MSIILNGSQVVVQGSYLQVPPLNNSEQMAYGNCLSNYTVEDFRCTFKPAFNSSNSDFRMHILMVARDGLLIGPGVWVDAPTIEGNNLNFI